MSMNLKEIDHGNLLEGHDALQDVVIQRVRFYRKDNRMDLDIQCREALPFPDYCSLIEGLSRLTGSVVFLHVHVENSTRSSAEIRRYISWFGQTEPECAVLCDTAFTYDENTHTVSFLMMDDSEVERNSSSTSFVEQFLRDAGFPEIHVVCTRKAETRMEVKDVVMKQPVEKESAPAAPVVRKKSYYRTKMEDYTKVDLKDVKDPIGDVIVEGDIFAMEDIETKKGTLIQSMSIFDGTDAIKAKRFEGRGTTREMMAEYKTGNRIRAWGRIEFDNFEKDLVLSIQHVEVLEKEKVTDPAPEKRIEWHAHTLMSEMDGVCDVREVVNYAFQLGHQGIVITDHADVQAFVKAYREGLSCAKKDPDRHFRVGFGCEMNMVNDEMCIVRNKTDENLDDVTYISYDLETTGLSCYYDHIIEFGAVKIRNQTVVDRIQMFIRPPVPIPGYITNKTNITNDMVRNAKPFKDCYQEILEWIGDGVLVAHNATFDYHFINAELRRIGVPPLTNTVIDTLDMARAVLPERRAYRLGNISRYYHVTYDEEVAHRADYDAEALAGVFLCLLKDAKEKLHARTIADLQDSIQGEDAFRKMRRSHVEVIVRNQDGMRDLYQLVTKSNTSTLAVMGKATGKEGTDVAAEARILRSDIQKNRNNLLIGSSCLNGELFELACNGDDERLREAMLFYDYVEVQPLSNYSTLIALGSIPSMDRLRLVIRRLIDCAKQLGIPVIADSDAHYCKKEEKIFREVYIMSQGVGGATHPLYIRDENLRMKTKNPDQHIRLTDEMISEFEWLGDEKLVHEIVIDNTHRLFDLIEDDIHPVPDGTFPPHIEHSDLKLRAVCEKTAHRMYEFEGKVPDIVRDRLEMELDNIIRNGYDVHYYIAHLLVIKSNLDGYVVGSRGSVGSSFTATMSGITEVNPLKPHYLCPHCHYSEWIDDPEVKSGFDLPDKPCPHCGTTMKGNGHNIPFQTFLGFNADKVPDIDLNFSNEYQWRAHQFIKEVFGESHAFRAGTIGTVADKTAFGYVQGYCEKMHIENMRKPMKDYLAAGCTNVKRTTGQHPGGIIIIPDEYVAEDFTPVQYPANDPSSAWLTTHYDFHDIHDNVLKFDILGHVDPTAMRLLQNIATVKPMDIPMNDPETLSLFYSDDALGADPRIYKKETGAVGLPEFGTATTRRVLEETRPHHFSELVMISGLSHGTDVWAGNAEALVQAGHPLSETIACRDDIMTYLMEKKLEPIDAFRIMEDVRKGKGLKPDYEEKMKAHNVPDWYIDSCKKIKYMFPKAHAVAYVMMAVRIAWYKVHEPTSFYIQYFTLRADAYEIETMTKGLEPIRERMRDIQIRMQDRHSLNPVSNREKALLSTLEVCEEMVARGYTMTNVDLYKSRATVFTTDPDNPKAIVPPFTVIDGLGANVAKSIEEARNAAAFLSKEDLERRTQLSSTMIRKLDTMGVTSGLSERNQLSLF
ncbi:MAG: PolC-type DNA polymerase III [Bulleidia sp.]